MNSAIRECSTGAVNKNAQLLIQDTCLGEHSEAKKELWQELAKVMVFQDTELPRGLHPEKAGTNEAAHIWCSDTLRLFFPEFKHNHKVKSSRLLMQACLDKVADSYAEGFAASAARYIFRLDSSDVISKLHKVYRQAANLSYNLWTRRVHLKITTLEGLDKMFDDKDPKTILHTTVTEDEDKLTGQDITILVHPLVEAYGTEQAEHFDRSRIWGPAEV
ncbi:hypothetical protein SS1G_11687 [Sclerotinia sclerotiorum 1980 UF-70]|uniref:Uncharacterized protein n=2 Tax=Sclerotinia sclerotiorum (strain ATCC 18683 / 1980 / Ss-1) TaxID=665079 RepID=A7F266_SCLS1|nr:hypothetical protein SS1G_11687 [Sclerotinia sclerotiorum 1980 UF-70]APA11419.1 hypothetical protein sscle_07g061890 [Sclerotinia sclerotiorum 1980 UF-70]EDN95808.1 hypothetical protein SS1G_11687 [Sclerotinia sclerotiorum 1980 UF-70]